VLAQPGTVLRLSSNLAVTATIHLKLGPQTFLPLAYLSYDNGSLWATAREQLSHIDAGRRAVRSTVSLPDVGPVAVGGGHVWVSGQETLYQFDAAGRRLERQLTLQLGELTVFGRWVWVVDQSADAVALVDPERDNLVRTIAVGKSPTSVAAGYGSIWVASEDGTVTRLDPETGDVVKTIHVGGAPQDIAIGYGRVWLAAP
jgi:DNA-binding beta-propeller fold protein YncE